MFFKTYVSAGILSFALLAMTISGCKGREGDAVKSPEPAPPASHNSPTQPVQGNPEAGKESPEYTACMTRGDAAAGVTSAMAECGTAELTLQDAKVNAAYKLVMGQLEVDQKEDLRRAQRAWIKFRDAKCASESDSGGTIDILNGQGCLLDATMRRTIELEGMVPSN